MFIFTTCVASAGAPEAGTGFSPMRVQSASEKSIIILSIRRSPSTPYLTKPVLLAGPGDSVALSVGEKNDFVEPPGHSVKNQLDR